MTRPIAVSLSPNTQKDDVRLAVKLLLMPWRWFDIKAVEQLERRFEAIFGSEYKALAVNSGRSAEYLILKALKIGSGHEVAIQAFNCVAVPNAIFWAGARPVYIDVDESYNLDPNNLGEKWSENMRAIIVQHTFGTPARIDLIKKIVQERGIFLIEDCAHCLGGTFKGKLLGSFGNVSFFSFGRDKILSSVFGGIILCKDKKLYTKLRRLRDNLDSPSYFWVFQQLLHPILFSIILPTYSLGFGKIALGKLLLFLFQKMNLLSFPIYSEEKIGRRPKEFPKKMPAALSFLAAKQLDKLQKYNLHRGKIAEFYFKTLKNSIFKLPSEGREAVWLRFPIRLKKAGELYIYAKRKGVLLGNWYKGVIQGAKDLKILGYKKGTCPMAEEFSEEVLNLPTYPTMSLEDAKKVVDTIKAWQNSL